MRLPLRAAIVVALSLGSTATTFAAEVTTQIVAAENFYGDVARQIGGSHVDVTSILSNPDEDPHLFETSPSTAKALEGADVVVYNGVDYDPWMEKLLSASKKPGRATIVAASLVGAKSGDNPHLWYEPETLPDVAAALAAKLQARDPADAADYKANLAAFEKSFAPIDKEITAIRAAHKGLKVTATEPVFGYMAKALGFEMLNGEFQISIMNNAEPSASQVAGFEDSIKSGKAKVLFYNSQVTDKTTQRLKDMATAAHIPVIGVTETEPKDLTVASVVREPAWRDQEGARREGECERRGRLPGRRWSGSAGAPSSRTFRSRSRAAPSSACSVPTARASRPCCARFSASCRRRPAASPCSARRRGAAMSGSVTCRSSVAARRSWR